MQIVEYQSLSCVSLQPHGLQPARLLCPQSSPSKSGLPFPSPGDLPDPGMESVSPALVGRLFTTEPSRKPRMQIPGGKKSNDTEHRASKQCPKYQGFGIPVLSHTELLDSEGTCEPVLQMHSLLPLFFPVRKRQLHIQNKFKCIIWLFNIHQVNFVKIFQTPF